MVVIYSCCRHLWCLESNVPLDFDDKKRVKNYKKSAQKGSKMVSKWPKNGLKVLKSSTYVIPLNCSKQP